MSYAPIADEPGGMAPAALSVLVHAGFALVLIFGLNWQSSRPDAVVVELWNQLPPVEAPAKIEPKPEPKPVVKPPPRSEPKVEVRPKKPDIAVEREKKAPKKTKTPPPLRFDTNKLIQEQLAQEQQALNQREKQDVIKQFAAPSAPVIDAGYADRIRSRIKSNIVLPPDIKGNPEAIFEVIQLPTGEVLSAHLRQSSGHAAYDEAVERAILKSSPLPRPDRPEQFRRDLLLKFRPQG
jgi:colicin import membrane protein